MKNMGLSGHQGPVSDVHVSREGDLVFSSGRRGMVNLYRVDDGRRLGTYDGHTGAVHSVDTTFDTEFLLTASASDGPRIFRVHDGVCLAGPCEDHISWGAHWMENPRLFASCFRPIGTLARTRSPAIEIWRTPAGLPVSLDADPMPESGKPELLAQPMRTLDAPGGSVLRYGVSIEHDEYYVSTTEEGDMVLWDVETGKVLKYFGAHEDKFTALKLGPRRLTLMTASKDHTGKLWDVTQVLRIKQPEALKQYRMNSPVNAIAMHPNQDQVVMGGGQAARDVADTAATDPLQFHVHFYHRITKQLQGTAETLPAPINAIEYLPDGSGMVVGAENGYVLIFKFGDILDEMY